MKARARVGGGTDIEGMRSWPTRIEGGCTSPEEQTEGREDTEEAHAELLAQKGIGEGAGVNMGPVFLIPSGATQRGIFGALC